MINYKELAEEQNETAPLSGKFRGLDPFIQEDNQLKRLTAIDSEYCKEYNRIKARLTHETMLNDIDSYIPKRKSL
jgi:hypothetical protein